MYCKVEASVLISDILISSPLWNVQDKPADAGSVLISRVY
jgi:hypothetical protein